MLKNFQKFENTTTITSSESKSSSLFRKLLGNGLNMYKHVLLQPIILWRSLLLLNSKVPSTSVPTTDNDAIFDLTVSPSQFLLLVVAADVLSPACHGTCWWLDTWTALPYLRYNRHLSAEFGKILLGFHLAKNTQPLLFFLNNTKSDPSQRKFTSHPTLVLHLVARYRSSSSLHLSTWSPEPGQKHNKEYCSL